MPEMVFGANVYTGQPQLVACTGGARVVRRKAGDVRRVLSPYHRLRIGRTVQAMPPGMDPEKLKQLQEEAMKNPEVGESVRGVDRNYTPWECVFWGL